MQDSSEFAGRAGDQDVRVPALVVWAAVAAVVVVALFPLFHAMMSHALAIVTAGIGGVVVGAMGYRFGGGNLSRRGVTFAAALGGGVGVFALHLLPLFH